jgi:hypothetical protein
MLSSFIAQLFEPMKHNKDIYFYPIIEFFSNFLLFISLTPTKLIYNKYPIFVN